MKTAIERRDIERKDNRGKRIEDGPDVPERHRPHHRGDGAMRAGDRPADAVDIHPDGFRDPREQPSLERDGVGFGNEFHRSRDGINEESQKTDDVRRGQREEIVLHRSFAPPAADERAESGINDEIDDIAEHHPFGQGRRDEPFEPDRRLQAEDPVLQAKHGGIVPSPGPNELQRKNGDEKIRA